jgi:asparagine synthase (glutamine-hydrolysing)
MTGLLVLWPREPSDLAVRGDLAAAARREPLDVLVAGGPEPGFAGDLRLFDVPEGSTGRAHLEGVWARYGRETPDRLVGEFAFARWDPDRSELFLARDAMGLRPLVYARYRGGVAVASDVRSLLALPGVDVEPDELAIAMTLVDRWVDAEATMYRGIRRLPGGRAATIRDGSIRSWSWWKPPTEDLTLPSDADYLEALRAAMTEAVRCRLPADGSVASELSGGIDSSIVCAIALAVGAEPLLTLSGSFAGSPEGDRYDEGRHRRWLADDPRTEPVEIPVMASLKPAAVDEVVRAAGAPFAGLLLLLRRSFYEIARSRGAAVVFDGLDGDLSINYGTERMASLAMAGELRALTRELRAGVGRWGTRRGLLWGGYSVLGSSVHRVRWAVSKRRLLSGESLVDQGFLERAGFWDAIEASSTPIGDVRAEHVADLRSGGIAMTLETTDALAAEMGIEIAHPFFDRRVVDLAVSLPPDLLYRDAVPRWIERAAFDHLVPDDVLWRGDKGGIPPSFGVATARATLSERMTAEEPGLAAPFVDRPRYRDAVARLAGGTDVAAAFGVHTAGILDRWLGLRSVR